MGDNRDDAVCRRTRSGGPSRPPVTPVRERSVDDEDESPSKRVRRRAPNRRQKNVTRKLKIQESEEKKREYQMKAAWSDLHEYNRTNVLPEYGGDDQDEINELLKDDICLICREPGALTVCSRCVHAVCSDCITIETSLYWHCVLSGLHCTERHQKREVGHFDDQNCSPDQLPSPKLYAPKSSGSFLKIDGVKYVLGDYAEVHPAVIPGMVRTRVWSSDYDSDLDIPVLELARPYFARIVSFRTISTAEVEFLIYPDQTKLPSLASNELLLTTTKYTLSSRGLIGRMPKPVLAEKRAGDDYYLVRYRYDIERRILRPLLECHGADEEIIIDVLDHPKSRSKAKITHIEDAIQRLQLSRAPEVLPCREKERAEIESFLNGEIRVGGSGGAMYISGLPGTGKTATVRRVIQTLQQKPNLPKFQYVEVNALKLQSPPYAYTHLWQAISGKRCSPAKALEQLQEYYGSAMTKRRQKRTTIVLVLDEFDYLIEGKTHKVIYNLFGFPTSSNAGLVVVGIANTLDVPERIGGRVFSRAGIHRMNFEAYKANQIECIIMERLKGLNDYIDTNAITLCAKSIASTSGDLRRALEIIATAIELCCVDGGKLTINHVTAARKKFHDTPAIQYIRGSAFHEAAVVIALLQETKASGRNEADYAAVIRRMNRLISVRSREVASTTIVERIVLTLAEMNLVMLCHKRDVARPSLRLLINTEDVRFALAQTPLGDINL